MCACVRACLCEIVRAGGQGGGDEEVGGVEAESGGGFRQALV